MRDFSNDMENLSLNTATVRQRWNLEQIIDGCARHGIVDISPWRDQVADCGLEKSAKLIRDAGLTVSALCRGGMFPAADARGRQAAIDDNCRAIDEAVALGSRSLVLVVGGLPEGSRDLEGAREQVLDGMRSIQEYALSCNMPLAIEPLHPMYAADRACVNTLKQALDMCDRLGEGVGVAVDVYHVWWDPELREQIMRAGRSGKLFGYHVCDWMVPTQDLLLDRGMMGDGVIDLKKIRGWVEEAGFNGKCEVEIFSAENWWKKDPDEVLKTCIERHQSVV
ncbi:sugar phosphate isomerase/epimerase family protein [Marinobacterium lutimaris]|uniref:Sugar phosphate isomerase/epimerase n=1 Tax=Marinobacterium lutimaris TaxID=568106 RepID=A0A1H6B433_9GAMM|nr:sugar phosphate isomerase/epimerase [Marinobacterium lutimaris]SEG55370.1 Sugar phosphate isomerase/epimerase [Marinobacterium lutimaris]